MYVYVVQWDNELGYEEKEITLVWAGTGKIHAYAASTKRLDKEKYGHTIITTWKNGELIGVEYMLLDRSIVYCDACLGTGVLTPRYTGETRTCWCQKNK